MYQKKTLIATVKITAKIMSIDSVKMRTSMTSPKMNEKRIVKVTREAKRSFFMRLV